MLASKNNTNDVVIVAQKRVACDGGGALGHPKTYLDMGMDTEVVCKYCGRVYQLDENAMSSGH